MHRKEEKKTGMREWRKRRPMELNIGAKSGRDREYINKRQNQNPRNGCLGISAAHILERGVTTIPYHVWRIDLIACAAAPPRMLSLPAIGCMVVGTVAILCCIARGNLQSHGASATTSQRY
eukprot:4666608-Pleurochrysis_carterae.AAC.1